MWDIEQKGAGPLQSDGSKSLPECKKEFDAKDFTYSVVSCLERLP